MRRYARARIPEYTYGEFFLFFARALGFLARRRCKLCVVIGEGERRGLASKRLLWWKKRC